MASPYIIHVHSQAEMETLLNEKSPVVVGFHAAWSAPCREIAPFYSRLAATHRTLTFVRVEIDAENLQSVGQKARLITLPTFLVVKNEEEVDRTRGADRKRLEDMVVRYAPEVEPQDRDGGSADLIAAGDESLLEYLDMGKVNCLNEAQPHTLKSIVETKMLNTTKAYLESDADEQLLITLPFKQEVKIRSVVLYTKESMFGPKKIKIDINRPALGFDDVESAVEPEVIQVLEVPEEVVKEGKPVHLRFVRLQRVNSLHIFVESNHGNEDVTRIDAIDVYGRGYGEPVATTQMSGLRDFWETHRRGTELLKLFQREGGDQNLSNGVALLRESALLCPAGHERRVLPIGNLATALLLHYGHRGDYADLSEAIVLCYEALELRPPGHPDRAASLSNLAGALSFRYECEGCLSDLEEAIGKHREALNLRPPGHPDRDTSLNNVATALTKRYEREGGYADLEEAIERHQEALNLRPPGHPDRAASLTNLANILSTRYQHEGSLSDLEEAVGKHREALNLCPQGHPIRAASLNNLANALSTRYEHEGGPADLEEAIEKHREALHLRPPGHPDRAASLNNLANALSTRHKRQGGLEDLVETIEKHREALNLFPPGHPDHAASLNSLANSLFIRYKQEGSLSDLEEMIEKHQEALNLRPPGHPDRDASLNNLANALSTRYEREGSLADLEEAIGKHQEALKFRPPGHPNRAATLNDLAHALFTRYQHEGSLLELEETIEKHREALNLRPPGHPYRAESLDNLGNALFTWYTRKGSLSDLEEAIEKHREALNLRPPGHPDCAASLNNLANALWTRFKCEGSLADLEEAIGKHREALNLRPPGHPDRATSFNNLANALFTLYQREGSLSDLKEMIERHREALSLCPPGHPLRAESLHNLANSLFTQCELEGSLSDLEETIEKHREALNLRPPGNPRRAESLSNLANALSTRYRHQGGLSDLEEMIEMYREALDLCPLGHPYRAASLNNLANALFTRYEREASLSDLEETIERHREALELHPPGHPNRATSLSNLAHSLSTRYEHEGSLPNLEETIEKHREALDLCPPGHSGRAVSLDSLGNALSNRYKHEGSRSDLDEAIAQLENALELCPHGHPDHSRSLISLSRAYLLVIDGNDGASTMRDNQTLVNKVFPMFREAVYHYNSPPFHRLQAALHWIDASPTLAPESALEAYSAALDQLDIILATSSTLASKHSRLSSKQLSQYQRLGVKAALCAVRQGDMAIAVELLERGRNLLFAQIGRYRIDLDELQRENAELAKRFSDLSCLLDLSVVSNEPTLKGRTTFEDPVARYRRVASDWDRVVNHIRALPRFENFLRPPDYTTLQAAAAEGPIIIVIPDAGQSHALIMLQDRDTPHYVNLPKAGQAELVTLCDEFLQAVQSEDEEDADGRITALLRKLWVTVVSPIANALENELRCPLHSRIWWCPASYISILPLHAAGRYASNTDPNQNFPARYVSSYTPTLQALGRARSTSSDRKEESMLIIAQPDTPGQGRLPNTIPEAEVVKALAETELKMKVTLLSSNEGTRAAVLDRMVDHSWIHLTCHGSQNFANPFDSCFCLYDNQLTLRDVIQRGLPNADFAFLAACHTATGDAKLLDEGLHLAAGLQFAGFRSVVGTIWDVADIDGPVIAKAFYEALQPEGVGEEGVDCRGAAYALSKAVKDLRDTGVPLSRWIRHIHIGI